MKAGAMAFLEKPVQYHELVLNIERALELSQNSAALSSLARDGCEAYRRPHPARAPRPIAPTAMKKIGARTPSELIHLTIAGSPHDA